MPRHHDEIRLRDAVFDATLRAVTLVAILFVICLIAWLAGIAALNDLPWILAGVFAGSFMASVIRHGTKDGPHRS